MNQAKSTDTGFLAQLAIWGADPNLFVHEACRGIPDTWQVEALAHMGDKPRTVREYTYLYTRAREWYREHPNKEHGAKNLELAKKWDKKWITRQYKSRFRRVTVKSGHGVGKSTWLAWVALWFMICFYPVKAGSTAPTSHQLEDVLWAEISTWYDRMPGYLRKSFKLTSLRLESATKPKESFMVGKTARKEQPEALQGLHKENTLIEVDECSGVHDTIFESSEGIMTARNSRAALGSNPTRVSGFFFDSHNAAKQLWHCITVSCHDSPRVGEDYITNCRVRYGVDSNRYRIRVLGQFPRTDSDAVVPRYLIEDAQTREVAGVDAPLIWGLDVARFGDDRTSLSERRGNVKPSETIWWNGHDTMQTVGKVVDKYKALPQDQRPDDIVVDVLNMGAGVVDRLREIGLPARGVNVAETAPISDRFFRWRDELYWKMREWFEALDCKIMPEGVEDDFVDEVATPKYTNLSSGKVQVQSKADIKKDSLHKRSPDLSDSFMLTFASYKTRGSTKELQYPPLGIV